jgi:hypothetical protein
MNLARSSICFRPESYDQVNDISLVEPFRELIEGLQGIEDKELRVH